MLAKTPLQDLAISWLQEQNPDCRYDWNFGSGCACAQIAAGLGRSSEWETFRNNWCNPEVAEWNGLNRIARGDGSKDWTYGKFLERLKALA